MRSECKRRRKRDGEDRDSLLEAHCGHFVSPLIDLADAEKRGGERSARRQE
jgi:hypothetical protein